MLTSSLHYSANPQPLQPSEALSSAPVSPKSVTSSIGGDKPVEEILTIITTKDTTTSTCSNQIVDLFQSGNAYQGYTHVLACPACDFLTLSFRHLQRHFVCHSSSLKSLVYTTFTCRRCGCLSTEGSIMVEHVKIYHRNAESPTYLIEEQHSFLNSPSSPNVDGGKLSSINDIPSIHEIHAVTSSENSDQFSPAKGIGHSFKNGDLKKTSPISSTLNNNNNRKIDSCPVPFKVTKALTNTSPHIIFSEKNHLSNSQWNSAPNRVVSQLSSNEKRAHQTVTEEEEAINLSITSTIDKCDDIHEKRRKTPTPRLQQPPYYTSDMPSLSSLLRGPPLNLADIKHSARSLIDDLPTDQALDMTMKSPVLQAAPSRAMTPTRAGIHLNAVAAAAVAASLHNHSHCHPPPQFCVPPPLSYLPFPPAASQLMQMAAVSRLAAANSHASYHRQPCSVQSGVDTNTNTSHTITSSPSPQHLQQSDSGSVCTLTGSEEMPVDAVGGSTVSGGDGGSRPHRQNFTPSQNRVLLEWYQTHRDKPYPSTEDTKFLAGKCDLTYPQVKKWFANKRARSSLCSKSCSSSSALLGASAKSPSRHSPYPTPPPPPPSTLSHHHHHQHHSHGLHHGLHHPHHPRPGTFPPHFFRHPLFSIESSFSPLSLAGMGRNRLSE